MTYNGHKNWNHWNVSLWLMGSDECLYYMVRDKVRKAKTLDRAAENIMEWLRGLETPDGAPYTFTSVRAALQGCRAGCWI